MTHIFSYFFRELHYGQLKFYVKRTKKFTYSFMFARMEDLKKKLDIQDYSISQVSLEHIFLSVNKRSKN